MSEPIDGHDFRKIASEFYPCAEVYFMDKDRNIHPVCSFKRTRVKDCGPINLLLEDGVISQDFNFRLDTPPQELIDYLNNL